MKENKHVKPEPKTRAPQAKAQKKPETEQQKYEAKWGQGEITYVYKIKNGTPDSSIILLPPKKTFTDVGFKSAPDLPWITYFLYPRIVVYEDEKATNPNYAKANYLVSINGWGIDKVSTPIEKPEPFMILKLK